MRRRSRLPFLPAFSLSAGQSLTLSEVLAGFDVSEGGCVPAVPSPGSTTRGSPARLLQISCSSRFTLHWDPIHLILAGPVILMTVKPEAAKSLDQLNVDIKALTGEI